MLTRAEKPVTLAERSRIGTPGWMMGGRSSFEGSACITTTPTGNSRLSKLADGHLSVSTHREQNTPQGLSVMPGQGSTHHSRWSVTLALWTLVAWQDPRPAPPLQAPVSILTLQWSGKNWSTGSVKFPEQGRSPYMRHSWH